MRPRALELLRRTAAAALVLVAWPAETHADNLCDQPGDEPDVIVGAIETTQRWGEVGGVTAYSVGTISCNVGSCWLNWLGLSADHPVIGQNLFRLRDGRFEQIGQSWLKHGFATLNGELCGGPCEGGGGSHLGVGCSDPYYAGLNGSQTGLGPKFEVNPSTGVFPYPATDEGATGDPIYKRLQARNVDLDPALNPGAAYFVEAQYVTRDDAAAGNQYNNASWRSVNVTTTMGQYHLTLTGPTHRTEPAIHAWIAADPQVALDTVDVPGDGRFLLASRVVVHGSSWTYEYAVQNLNSHRAARSFSVGVRDLAEVSAVGFHDVDYHSGEPFDGTDWTVTLTPGAPAQVVWSTDHWDEDPSANALRWGTLYNFRFTAKSPPQLGTVTLGLYRPGVPATVGATLWVPRPCNWNAVCDGGESCATCPDCVDQGGVPGTCCGDGTCEGGEIPCSCDADCGPCDTTCAVPADCDDGIYCDGLESCGAGGQCVPGVPPCPPASLCDEAREVCVECFENAHCLDLDLCDGVESCVGGACVAEDFPCEPDELFCNGVEGCAGRYCVSGLPPCPGACDEETDTCVECVVDGDCEDGLYCNGPERCVDQACVPGGIDPCAGEPCSEEFDACGNCAVDEDCQDGSFCNGAESCVAEFCLPPLTTPCPALCDDVAGECLGTVWPQELPGMPLLRTSAGMLERFAAGRLAVERQHAEPDGLGPAYNAAACAGCHDAETTVTRFGIHDELAGGFDPLARLGGPLLQTTALAPACEEELPPAATWVGQRVARPLAGSGLVEAIADADLAAREQNPPPGVTGVVHWVEPLDAPGTSRAGRFGWQSRDATLLDACARDARDQLGLTNRLLPAEDPPNGDVAALAACDTVADPEDGPDGEGLDFIDRTRDYLRFLAPPPQSPPYGTSGELLFNFDGCAKCHVGTFLVPDDAALDPGLRGRLARPFSDFLLHDMGDAGDPSTDGTAQPREVRTAPLWALRTRSRWWHDGRIAGGTFEDRVHEAVQLHAAPGSEAAASAASFLARPASQRATIAAFLASLGRLQFDLDGDDELDPDDVVAFDACAAGGPYNPNHPCTVADSDRDNDVDDDDRALLRWALGQALGGAVPDGATLAGDSLRIGKLGAGEVELSWGASCNPYDDDYAVYQGTIGDFASHAALACTTGGARSIAVDPPAGDRYFLVVPRNGLREGGYGYASDGAPRPASTVPCAQTRAGPCP